MNTVVSLDLSLALFDPWAIDLTDLSKRISQESQKDWLKVTQSTIPDAGAGLFSNRTFKKGQIITVYCGKVSKKEPSDYAVEYKGRIIDPKRDGEIPMYWGAHFANDYDWHKEGELPQKARS